MSRSIANPLIAIGPASVAMPTIATTAAKASGSIRGPMATRGPPATICCEPRQARKGAAAAADACAGVWLSGRRQFSFGWFSLRRGVRAAEGARLESVYGVKLIEGSNPSLSATSPSVVVYDCRPVSKHVAIYQ